VNLNAHELVVRKSKSEAGTNGVAPLMKLAVAVWAMSICARATPRPGPSRRAA
jgi:hypothetical protein